MSAILPHMMWPQYRQHSGLSANLECRSEIFCTRLDENIGCKKIAKNLPSGHYCTTLLGCIFATKARIDNREKNLLSNNISFTCSHNMVNSGPLVAKIGLPVCSTPANFNGFHVLASLLHRGRSTDVSQTLHDVWPSPGLAHCIFIFGGSCP